MLAVTEPDTHTITIMAATQVVKTELLTNVAGYFIHQDPSPILFVQPTQSSAQDFSKERFAPTVAASPALRDLVKPPRTRGSENTITHKDYPGGSLDFVGANSPGDLASRPKRIILCDEIDKYPTSAGTEGDPLWLAEERASTYHDIGRAKFVRACSPTVKGESRIGREYEASDRRKCFVLCPHCGEQQHLTWGHVRWEKTLRDGSRSIDVPIGEHARAHHPETASIACAGCGTLIGENERRSMLDELAEAPAGGWRQTRRFECCDLGQEPEAWDGDGRSLCCICGERSPYDGHAGFQISKLYSRRHRLANIVSEFFAAQGNPDLLTKWTNTALAETYEREPGETIDASGFGGRAEPYGPDDVPNEVLCVTGFCDVQGDRLEVQLVGWGEQEEAWPILYRIIPLDPAQPDAWRELETLRRMPLHKRNGQMLRVAAFGVDLGGHHGAQVYAYTRPRQGQRVFACHGRSGKHPVWTPRAKRSKTNDVFHFIGVDTAKDAVYGRLLIEPPEPGERKAGYIHFPDAPEFGPEYFKQLTAERRETRRRMGQAVTVWVCPKGKRNEALDTFVGALAVRRSLPRSLLSHLEFRELESPQDKAERVARQDQAAEVRRKAQFDPETGERRQGFLGGGARSGARLPERRGGSNWLGTSRGWLK